MSLFIYDGRDKSGKPVNGTVEAGNKKEAVTLIRQRGLFIVKIKENKGKGSFTFSFFKRISFDEIVNFTRQLSTMVTAGLQLPEALLLLSTQTTNPLFAEMVTHIMRDIEGGGSFGAALTNYPAQFNQSYTSLIKAGESSGNLDVVLSRLAENLEKDREFRAKVKAALIYPVIILIAMFVVVAVLMLFVIPQISQLYSDFGFDLPLTTKILITASQFSVRYWWLLMIVGVAGIYGLMKFRQSPLGARFFDMVFLRLPLFGNLTKQLLLVEFTRSLGMLIGAGIHLLDALSILTTSVPNILYREAVGEVAKKVEKGYPLAGAFAQHEVFPPILSQMIKVGEETGKLDDSLVKLSLYFESESEHTVKGLTTAIEPLIMVILGIGVGFIVISIITPIYNLTSQIK